MTDQLDVEVDRPKASLAENVADSLRQMIMTGKVRSGDRLSEAWLTSELDVSRNTVREALRLLTNEGLLTHEVNRGVQVTTLSMASLVDLYRVRRLLEVNILRAAAPHHPEGDSMRRAVDAAYLGREERDWERVTAANLDFHRSVIALADSKHLNRLCQHLAVEMKLAFGLIDDPEYLQSREIEANDQVVTAYERGEMQRAAEHLDQHLLLAERIVLGAYSRVTGYTA